MNRVRELRQEKKMSQEALGEYVGLTQSYIAKIERGERQLSEKLVVLFAKALNVRPAELFENLGDAQPLMEVRGELWPDDWKHQDKQPTPEISKVHIAKNPQYAGVDHFTYYERLSALQPSKHEFRYYVCVRPEDAKPEHKKEAIVERWHGSLVQRTIATYADDGVIKFDDGIDSDDTVLGVVVIYVSPLVS